MFRFYRKSNTHRGFTLVELVIVVAVLAILIGIMVPFFGDVQKDAEAAELRNAIQTAYTKFADEQISSGNRVAPMDSYLFVKADRVILSDGVATELENITFVCSWDGKSDDVWTDDYISLQRGDRLYSQRYGEFFIIYRRK